MDHVDIIYFSDILCVWAYVEQARTDELTAEFGEQVRIAPHFVQVFGDARGKLERDWSERGGPAGYAAHIREVCARYEAPALHSACWVKTVPRSSLVGHLFLRAVGVAELGGQAPPGSVDRVARELRSAFFRDGLDISQRGQLRVVAEGCNLDVDAIDAALDCGAAHAALDRDFELARTHDVRISPTLILSEGRQRIAGNVGYRVLEANIRELLAGGREGASWC